MNYQETLVKVKDLINGLMIVLSDKEKYIIENRFSLVNDKKLTLEKIGQNFNVTRERIRQIEKNALRKLERNVNNTELSNLTNLAIEALQELGGIGEENRVINLIKKKAKLSDEFHSNSLKLTIDLTKEITHVYNTIKFRPHWKINHIKGQNVKIVTQEAYKVLSQTKEITKANVLASQVLKNIETKVTQAFAISCFDLDRRLKVLEDGSVGLATWRNINPKTLRDKIFYVLREFKKPMHYIEISDRITMHKFDSKTVNTQAVHNELIRFKEFVLIGRGIYALKEWGYKNGTVADVITEILKENGAMNRNEIVAKVLEKRHVKRITILLNLKNKDLFERVGKNTFDLKN